MAISTDRKRQMALDDLIHAVMSTKASGINNEGEKGQIDFLKSEGWTDEEIEKTLLEKALQDAAEEEISKA